MRRHGNNFNQRQPGFSHMGMKVRTIRCEGDADAAIHALFQGEEFVPRFFSDSLCDMYVKSILHRSFLEDNERHIETMKQRLLQKMFSNTPKDLPKK